jgi:hypothetical protein
MVVIREEERNQRTKKQPTLFELMGYSYQVIVTNNIEEMLPEEVWRFYNGRANIENMIKEGILSYSLDINISHFYGANAAHFHLVMREYNFLDSREFGEKWQETCIKAFRRLGLQRGV